jgi:hypothetical protein
VGDDLDEHTGADSSPRRSKPFLHTLSPDLQNGLPRCLACWRPNLLCTMFNRSHFCFCIWLLESVLAAADAHALKGYRDTPKIQLQKKGFC